MLKTNTIIKLKNNDSYVILNEVNFENEPYFLVMGVDEKKDVIPSKVLIIKEVTKGDKTFIKIIADQDTIIKVTKKLKENI
ncbi:MAG: hypothetical protein J5892_00585 [Bacilli bacterium]|nr:hypothetical protein [Bacilli bacterium]